MKKHSFATLFIIIILCSCKKKSDNALWNIQALAPLVQSSLTLDNIIKDTSSIKKNTDNSISVVVRKEMVNIITDSLVTLSVAPYTKRVKLSTLVLSDQTIVRNITLGELARALKADVGNPTNVFIGTAILNSQGSSVTLPPINNLSSNNLPLDVKQFFDDATFLAGDMEIKIDNNLPIAINNLSFDVKNAVSGTTVANQTFPSIPVGGTVTQTEDLSGKTVEGNLLLNLLDLDLAGGTVVIDTNDAIVLNISIKNVSLSAATAIFPEQNVIDETEDIILEGLGEVELYEAWIASGEVKAVITSTLNSQFDVTYSIPGASKNSVPFEITKTIPGSSNGSSVVENITEDFSGYVMNLRSDNNDTVNTFSNRLVGKLPYTGQKVYITLDDSVDVVVTMENPLPSYVKGYLGRDTASIGPANISLDLFSKIESGILNFENAAINMVIENSLGITGAIKINSVTASNSKTGAFQSLSGPYIGNAININKATDMPLTPITQIIDLSTGSNAIDLLNILPNQFTYDIQVISNPAGNDLTYSDFAYSTGGLKAYLDIEMPMSFISSELTLSDTVSFNAASLKKKSVNKGIFSLHVSNGFPLEAGLKMYVLDQNFNIIDSLTSPSVISAAPVDGNKRVTEKFKSIISYEIDEQKMYNIYNSANMIFKVKFSTLPTSTYLKLYSDYSIDFNLVGDMNYSIH